MKLSNHFDAEEYEKNGKVFSSFGITSIMLEDIDIKMTKLLNGPLDQYLKKALYRQGIIKSPEILMTSDSMRDILELIDAFALREFQKGMIVFRVLEKVNQALYKTMNEYLQKQQYYN